MDKQKQLASEFIYAITKLSMNEKNLDNLECYLSQHFEVWMKKFANTPEKLTAELKCFADMEF